MMKIDIFIFLTVGLFFILFFIYSFLEKKHLRKEINFLLKNPKKENRKISKKILFLCLVLSSYLLSPFLFLILLTLYLGQQIYVSFVQKKIMSDFENSLLEGLEQISRLLGAGMPLSKALQILSESKGVFPHELQLVLREMERGKTMKDAFQSSLKSFPLGPYRYFVTVLEIQNETGSSIKGLFENLHHILKSQKNIEQKAKALSSEARFSILLIGSLPIVLFISLYIFSPSYILDFLNHSASFMILILALFFWLIGIFWMRKLSHLEQGG